MALGEKRTTGGKYNHNTAGIGGHATAVSKNSKT